MTLNKKIKNCLLGFIAFSAIAGCSSLPINSSALNTDNISVDVGNGINSGVSISLSINLANGNGFKTESSVSGSPQATVAANLKSLKFWLVEAATNSPPSGNVGGNFTNIKTVSLDTTTASHTATFTNVPDNSSSSKSYFVCAAAYNDTIGGTSGQVASTNITNLGATVTFGSNNRAFVSTAGGDPSNLGSINVTNVALVPSIGTASLSIPALKLLDGTGAIVDSSVTVTDGSSTIPATTVQ